MLGSEAPFGWLARELTGSAPWLRVENPPDGWLTSKKGQGSPSAQKRRARAGHAGAWPDCPGPGLAGAGLAGAGLAGAGLTWSRKRRAGLV